MNKQREVLDALQSGPVKVRGLIQGRSAAFLIAYRGLLRAGLIEEHGIGRREDPKYVGLKGATFPEKGYLVRSVDVDLLVRSGMARADAESALQRAVQEGGMTAVFQLCEQAHERILSLGKKPLVHVPPPKDKLKTRVSFPSLEEQELLNPRDFDRVRAR